MDDRAKSPGVIGTDLELRIAGTGRRSYAFVIDWHIRLLLAMAWYVAASLIYSGGIDWTGVEGGMMKGYIYLVAIPAAGIYFLYHPVLEVLMDGRTPGKRIAGIRVVTSDGQLPGPGTHLLRNVLRLVDSLPFAYLVGIVCTILTERNLRIGDIVAGTVLVYDATDEGTKLRHPAAAENSRARAVDAELVLELVERWDRLLPSHRVDMARKLLRHMGHDLPSPSTDAQVLAQLKHYLNQPT